MLHEEIEGALVRSKIGLPRISRERNDVSDVVEAGGEHNHSLEAQAESAVLDGAIAAQVQVPLVRL